MKYTKKHTSLTILEPYEGKSTYFLDDYTFSTLSQRIHVNIGRSKLINRTLRMRTFSCSICNRFFVLGDTIIAGASHISSFKYQHLDCHKKYRYQDIPDGNETDEEVIAFFESN